MKTIMLGKDGTPFNKTRWLNWATGKAPSALKFNHLQEPIARARAVTKTMKRKGNIRVPCSCGRMNHISMKICPSCGKPKEKK